MNEAYLKRQVARLKSLPRQEGQLWGQENESGLRDELLKELWKQAHTDEHATRIIDRLMEVCKFCPVPAEVIALAADVQSSLEPEYTGPQPSEVGPLCGSCDSWGWVVRGNKAERCHCENGRALPQKLLDLMNEQLRNPKSRCVDRRTMKSAGAIFAGAAVQAKPDKWNGKLTREADYVNRVVRERAR